MHIRYIDTIRSRLFHFHVSNSIASPSISNNLTNFAQKDIGDIFGDFDTSKEGLSTLKSKQKLAKFGPNVIKREVRRHWAIRLFLIYINPLTLLLSALVFVALLTNDVKTSVIVGSMILISVLVRFYQENKAYNSAESLRSLVHTNSIVIRDGKKVEIRLEQIVPGDVVSLTAGAIVPADVRIIESKDLSANQSLLTGEAMPIEKHALLKKDTDLDSLLDLQNLCFMGSNIESGTATAVVIATGSQTYFGSIAKDIVGEREVTSFDKGLKQFTWLMITFMAVLVPIVFLVNGFMKGDWGGAFLFAISVAVGLAPEMLPAIVAVNLTKGALDMSKKKVIVKRLSSIQNFGAMNILCSDKTGTLTRNEVVLVKNINIDGETDSGVLTAAYLNSVYQTGFKNLTDGAVVTHANEHGMAHIKDEYKKIDEIPFDFERRRLSIVVENKDGQHIIYTKGAVEEVASFCKYIYEDGAIRDIEKTDLEKISGLQHELNLEGFQVIAVSFRNIDEKKVIYSVPDERDLTFLGFMAFLDPPKESVEEAIKELSELGVSVKVLTGDNEYVTRKICRDVGLGEEGVLNGGEIAKMSDEELKQNVLHTTIFAKLLPEHKRRVIQALQANDCVVGFLGDGINDASALRTADVGISVNTATDIAKESADIILMDNSLSVLSDGVRDGRKVFGNITKYIKMGASSSFGNMFSMLGASILLPFLPMLPVQILANNLLYDFSQMTIPTDNVDKEYIEKPRKWHIRDIGRYMLCIGPISSLFDFATFGIMWFVFNASNSPSLFQTGWFIESLLTQTLIIHVIRSRKIPFLETNASKPLLISTVLVIAVGIALVYSSLAPSLGFTNLPLMYWPIITLLIILYIALTQIVKTMYIKKFGYN